MSANYEAAPMLEHQEEQPVTRSLLRKLGLPAALVLGLVATAGIVGHAWHSSQAPVLDGAVGAPELETMLFDRHSQVKIDGEQVFGQQFGHENKDSCQSFAQPIHHAGGPRFEVCGPGLKITVYNRQGCKGLSNEIASCNKPGRCELQTGETLPTIQDATSYLIETCGE